MSSSMYRNQLVRLQQDKARLEEDLAKQRSDLAKSQKKSSDLMNSISKTKSETTRKSKQRQWQSEQEKIAKTQKKIADIEKKLASNSKAIAQKQKQVYAAESRESKRQQSVQLDENDILSQSDINVMLSQPNMNSILSRPNEDIILPLDELQEVTTDTALMDDFRVFYSWQSWTPSKQNRHFILSATEKAAKAIRDDEAIEVEPVVDRDTLGEAGSVDIAATIFRKIAESQIFVCDVTIVTDENSPHPAPNPNVLIELGYAAAILGWDRIICVVNTAYGNVEKMPFDLRVRRLLTYDLPDGSPDKAQIKKNLTRSIKGAIESIIEKFEIELSVNDDEVD